MQSTRAKIFEYLRHNHHNMAGTFDESGTAREYRDEAARLENMTSERAEFENTSLSDIIDTVGDFLVGD